MIICKICGKKLEITDDKESIPCPSCDVEWKLIKSDFTGEAELYITLPCEGCGNKIETPYGVEFLKCPHCRAEWTLVPYKEDPVFTCKCNNDLTVKENDTSIICPFCKSKWKIVRTEEEIVAVEEGGTKQMIPVRRV